MPMTPDDVRAAAADPEWLNKRAAARCERGDHTPVRAPLDRTVWCSVCRAQLGHSD